MGMYTEIYVNVDLKKDTPKDVINVLQAICDKDGESEYLEGKPFRWSLLFNNGSYYTPNTECGKLTYDSISEEYSLLGKGDIKNYANEIQEFFDFIKPYCTNHFIGYMRYEEDDEPILIYKDG
jgi:hypothetical protein